MTVRHPDPKVIAAALREAATVIEQHGHQATRLAPELAARGYPVSTLGDGGSRGSSDHTSTERAALGPGNRWDAIDDRLAKALRTAWGAATLAQALVADVVAHAQDDDPVPAGTGGCQVCSTVCRPTAKRPNFRLRAGLCPTCYKGWLRADKPMMADWVRARRAELTAPNGLRSVS